jgi:vacuolar-type H+-ATPase subunit C/Vma6
MESRLVGREKLNQLLTAPTVGDVERALEEWGAAKKQEYGLKSAFEAVTESLPDKALLHFLQYPYDCHNLKAIEKCRIKGVRPDALLIDLGSVSTKRLLTVSEKEVFALLPTHMAMGVEAAREAFAKTGDPQEIDFILDRAAYADMAKAAAPYPFATELVRVQAELLNLLMCLRLLRMRNGELGRSILIRAALPVGSFDGGRMTEALLAHTLGAKKAYFIVSLLTLSALLLLWLFSVYLLLRAGGGLSLFCFSVNLLSRFLECGKIG